MKLWILFFIFHSQAFAVLDKKIPHGITVNADSSFRDTENETIELEGNVQVIYQDQHLSCDHAKVNLRAKSIDAIGKVLVVSPKATISGERVTLDYESSTGIIYDGYVQSGTVNFEGAIIYKTSDTEFIANQAKYTTCTNCPESWSFSGSKIRAELGGYAYIKNSILRLGGIPMLWLPYLVVPLKSERQTGLLPPEVGFLGDGGIAYSQSFFWAMSRNQDSTITLRNYELRGLKSLVNYRYVLAERSQGELDTAYLSDRFFPSDPRFRTMDFNYNGTTIDRWFFKYNHYYELPGGFVQRTNLNAASDLQYPKDFPLETRNNGDAAMENRFSVTKNTDTDHYSLDSSYYVNLIQSDPLGSNDQSVHRLPELRYARSLSKVGNSDFLYGADVNYTNFARTSFAYDNLSTSQGRRYLSSNASAGCASNPDWEQNPACYYLRTGTYNPDVDMIRSGQRFDGTVSLLRPFAVGRLDFLPRLSYRETQYSFPVGADRNIARRYARSEISARTSFSQIFNLEQQDKMKHEIQPEVTATAIPWIYQPQHKFFGSTPEAPFSTQDNVSDLTLNSPYGLQFDYNDRLYERKLVTFALVNKLIRKRYINGSPSYRQFFIWKVAQSYDAFQDESGGPTKQPFSDLSSEMTLTLDRLELYQKANYFPYQQVTNSSSSIKLIDKMGDWAQLSYDVLYSIVPGKEADANSRNEQYTLTLKKSVSFIDLVGKITYDIAPPSENKKIKSYGYGAQLRLPGDCWYISIVQYRPVGLDKDNFNISFDFSFDGQKKPGVPEKLLESFNF